MGETIVVASGYYDPIHVGHIDHLRRSKKLGDKLVVIVNNEKQAILKKGKEFMPFDERCEIVRALGFVDEVFPSIDEDASVCKSLVAVKPHIFSKGGDRFANEIPEAKVCEEHGIKIVDGVGEKIQSSSDLIGKG